MKKLVIVLFVISVAAPCFSGAEKPNIWVYSDFTDPRDQRDGGHPKGDQDDIVTLASLLLSANRFHIETIVLGSGAFSDISNPVLFVHEIISPAYKDHIKNLKDGVSGYQKDINYEWSAVSRSDGLPKLFKNERDYKDLSDCETVQSLAEYARDHEVTVLVWGDVLAAGIRPWFQSR